MSLFQSDAADTFAAQYCQTIGHMYGRYLDIVGKVTEDGGTTGELEAFEQVKARRLR
jgi:hypothetical protein